MLYIIGLIVVLNVIYFFVETQKEKSKNKNGKENPFVHNQCPEIDDYEFRRNYNPSYGHDFPANLEYDYNNTFNSDFGNDFGNSFNLDA